MAKEKYFDESYIKISKFMKTMVTKETLKIFMEKNPSLITYVPKEKVRVAVQRYEEYMKGHPIGSKILKQEKEDLKKVTNRIGSKILKQEKEDLKKATHRKVRL